jgi:hypothetical protein
MSKPFAALDFPTAAELNAMGYAYDRSTSEVDVTNTGTLTSLYSKSIGAGHLSTDRMAKLTLLGHILQNTGGAQSVRVQALMGGTTLMDDALNVSDDTDERPFEIVAYFANRAAANVNWAQVRVNLTIGASVAPTTGYGDLDAVTYAFVLSSAGNTAIDTSTAKTLDVKVTAPGGVNCRVRKKYALLELW